jgi:hypothetical protein
MTPHLTADLSSFTRQQGVATSYLDYFLSKEIEIKEVATSGNFGKSDHCVLQCRASGTSPILRRQANVFSKTRATKLLEKLFRPGPDFDKLMGMSALPLFRHLSAKLKRFALVVESSPRNYFQTIPLVEKELLKPAPDWIAIRRLIQSCRRTEFVAVLEKLRQLLQNHQMVDYYHLVGGLLQVVDYSSTVREIEDPANPGLIIHDIDQLNLELSAKYSALFASDSPRLPFKVELIARTSADEVTKASSTISKGKGLGIDMIPDSLLCSGSPRLLAKLVELINGFFHRESIPSPFCFSRLHLINKLKDGTVPTLNDLRPIMISSPIVKVVESIALVDLKLKLEP